MKTARKGAGDGFALDPFQKLVICFTLLDPPPVTDNGEGKKHGKKRKCAYEVIFRSF